MLINHISTDPYTANKQKKMLLLGWNKFKEVMSPKEKRDYQVRLYTIKHLKDKFCPIKDRVYFLNEILEADIKETLL